VADPVFVSFLSDYGAADEFVAVCTAIILRSCPEARVIDITHEVPAHDVRAGALTLARAAPFLPAGVILAVVDPGVGTDRRAVAVEVDETVLVGPDNGLLAPAVAMLGGAKRAVVLSNTEYQLPSPGATFAGRDVFAPAAGALAAGVDLAELGDEVDPLSLVPGLLPLPQPDAGALRCEVLWVDRFGNMQLNVDPSDLETMGMQLGSVIEVLVRDDSYVARWVHTYAEARPRELALVIDSYGLMSLAYDRDDAARALVLGAGSAVTLQVPTL